MKLIVLMSVLVLKHRIGIGPLNNGIVIQFWSLGLLLNGQGKFVMHNNLKLVLPAWRQFCSWWHLVRCGITSERLRSWKVIHAVAVRSVSLLLCWHVWISRMHWYEAAGACMGFGATRLMRFACAHWSSTHVTRVTSLYYTISLHSHVIWTSKRPYDTALKHGHIQPCNTAV